MSTEIVTTHEPVNVNAIDTNLIFSAARLLALFSSKSFDVDSKIVSDFETKYSNEIKYVKTIIAEDPTFLDSISTNLNQIVADGKIDLHDIPQIVLVLSKVVKLNFRKIVKNINVLSVVEYILHKIINSGLLPIPPVQKEVLNKVIETSIKLLEMNSEVIESNCKKWWSGCCS